MGCNIGLTLVERMKEKELGIKTLGLQHSCKKVSAKGLLLEDKAHCLARMGLLSQPYCAQSLGESSPQKAWPQSLHSQESRGVGVVNVNQ